MKIICLIKQVPDTELQPRIKSDQSGIESDNIKYIINPYDEYGIEEAVRLKGRIPDSEITVISLGEEKTKERIRTALAMGCDKGVLIKIDSDLMLDPISIAKEIANYIKGAGYDVIFAGKKAVDDELSVVGASVASLLDIPLVNAIRSFELNSDLTKVTCKCEGDSGDEIVETSLPALFTCEKGLNEPKYPSLPAIMKSKKKPIEEIGYSNLPSFGRIRKLELPPERKPGLKIEGELGDQVKEVIRLLKEEIKVLD
ncbi:MAG: electron transfer flavoprotein subunit beta/FixA family protein [Spirochaetota bacterium]|nr:electron transfer flavoprotein subunit beta/FixA family protein [Spirochaetota bacterium]